MYLKCEIKNDKPITISRDVTCHLRDMSIRVKCHLIYQIFVLEACLTEKQRLEVVA